VPIREVSRPLLALALSSAALVAAGCVRENAPAPGTGLQLSTTFLGYSTPETRQTMCGNCHVDKQQSWLKTGHAKAWADVVASGRADASCDKCHTTNGATNIGPDGGGYLGASGLARKYFQDVQCEACHGPGAAHVSVPDETQPIPYLVSLDSTLGVGCGECHSGAPHASFFEDWSHGAHRGLEAPAINNGGACLQCHEGKTVAQRFGGSDVFVEVDDAKAYPIGCASCHNPHGSDNTAELRESLTARDTTNLCMRCHQRNAVPDTANTRGPHSPQGPTFLGSSGWRPAGFTWDSSSMTTHSNPAANPLLCATCHVATLDVSNGGGQVAWHYTGHAFYAVPCVTATGVDSTDSCDISQRSFAACANSGCHSTADVAQGYFVSLSQEIAFLAGTIWTDVNGNGRIDAGDTGLLTQVPTTEFKRDSVITVAEGALFNVQLVNVDGSHGVHNPPYFRSLLAATTLAVQQQYALPVPPAAAALVAREVARLGVKIAER
jgi:predicted CXXCH cytochrome family protein